jgi:hypothetical protein
LGSREIPIQLGDIISYMDMCQHEGASLQRGMNFRLGGRTSVILMSVRKGATYADRIEEGGKVLIYEGHDIPRIKGGLEPKQVDQQEISPNGALTQNGLFWRAALSHRNQRTPAEVVKVYEKIKTGIWAYAGLFDLVDAQIEDEGGRKVFKFQLQISTEKPDNPASESREIEHNRFISAEVKREVWKRDKGQCVLCGSKLNLHFDHDLPFSKGGTSLLASNIRLLCAKYNLQKRDKIE